MGVTIALIGLATLCTTLLGGFFALRFKDHLHLVLGFSAGAVIGVAFFDLLPEAIELGSSVYPLSIMTSFVALGFTIYLILDRFAVLHSHDEGNLRGASQRGKLGAASFSLHSFLDGLAIGFAFKVSFSVGAIVSIAVLVHKFFDGINTVNLILINRGSVKEAYRWLFVCALMPLVGVLVTTIFSLSESSLGLVLALFCGFFLYIGASDLLPESQHRHPKILTTIMTLLGIAVLYGVIQFVGL